MTEIKKIVQDAMRYSLLFESEIAGVKMPYNTKQKIEFYLAACEFSDRKFVSVMNTTRKDILNYCIGVHKQRVYEALLKINYEKSKKRVKA